MSTATSIVSVQANRARGLVRLVVECDLTTIYPMMSPAEARMLAHALIDAAARAEGNTPQCRCPAGMRSADEIRAKLSRIQSLEYRPARPLTFVWGAIWALRWALGEATADRQWIICHECEDGSMSMDGERR